MSEEVEGTVGEVVGEADAAESEIGYAERVARLEAIVRDVEAGQQDLEATLALFEEGMGHLRACGDALDAAEGRLRELTLSEAESEASR